MWRPTIRQQYLARFNKLMGKNKQIINDLEAQKRLLELESELAAFELLPMKDLAYQGLGERDSDARAAYDEAKLKQEELLAAYEEAKMTPVSGSSERTHSTKNHLFAWFRQEQREAKRAEKQAEAERQRVAGQTERDWQFRLTTMSEQEVAVEQQKRKARMDRKAMAQVARNVAHVRKVQMVRAELKAKEPERQKMIAQLKGDLCLLSGECHDMRREAHKRTNKLTKVSTPNEVQKVPRKREYKDDATLAQSMVRELVPGVDNVLSQILIQNMNDSDDSDAEAEDVKGRKAQTTKVPREEANFRCRDVELSAYARWRDQVPDAI